MVYAKKEKDFKRRYSFQMCWYHLIFAESERHRMASFYSFLYSDETILQYRFFSIKMCKEEFFLITLIYLFLELWYFCLVMERLVILYLQIQFYKWGKIWRRLFSKIFSCIGFDIGKDKTESPMSPAHKCWAHYR